MNDIPDHELDALLRRAFTGAVEDDGFSARVLRALPVRRRPRPWRLSGATLAGGLLAWWALLPSPLLQQFALEWLASDFGGVSAAVYILLFGVSLLGCGWALEEQ